MPRYLHLESLISSLGILLFTVHVYPALERLEASSSTSLVPMQGSSQGKNKRGGVEI